MNNLLLALGGLAPCAVLLVLCIFILRRLQPPETYREIAVCLALALLSTIPVIVWAVSLDTFTERITFHHLAPNLYFAFVLAAIPEELARYCILRWRLGRRKDALDERRCLLLGAIVGLGFASLENPGFCVAKGWSTVWERAITSVPLHALAGAIVGYAVGYSLSKRQIGWSLLGLAVTIILHGFADMDLGLLYVGSSPADSSRPTDGIGLFIFNGWLTTLGAPLIAAGLVAWLAARCRFTTQPSATDPLV